MFIREKKINGKNYAYLVSTRWDKRSKKVKQKVSKYLGKVAYLDKIKEKSFKDYYEVDVERYAYERELNDIVPDLVELDLFRHGFEKKDGMMLNGEHSIDPRAVKGVFYMNEGYLSEDMLNQILRYDKILGKSESRIPFKFAELFVAAGLSIDKDLFVALYRRFFSDYLEK